MCAVYLFVVFVVSLQDTVAHMLSVKTLGTGRVVKSTILRGQNADWLILHMC